MIWVDQYRTVVGPPFVVGTTTQTTGAGTTSVQSIVPGTVNNGDAVYAIIRVSGTILTQPSGFTTKHSYNYLTGETIHVVSGVYNSGTHGGTLTWTTDPGVCRSVWWYLRNIDATTSSGFVSNNIGGGNDQFMPTLTTPAGDSIGMCYAFAGGTFSDLQTNGWTNDYSDAAAIAYHQPFTTSGAQTMPRWDNAGNVYQIAFYAVP